MPEEQRGNKRVRDKKGGGGWPVFMSVAVVHTYARTHSLTEESIVCWPSNAGAFYFCIVRGTHLFWRFLCVRFTRQRTKRP